MSWATVLTALKDALDGATISSPAAETLTCYELPPVGAVDVGTYPYAYISPSPLQIRWVPNQRRITTVDDVLVVVVLGMQNDGREDRAQYWYAWAESIATVLDGFQAADGAGATLRPCTINPPRYLDPEEARAGAYGFDVVVGLNLDEAKSLGA